MNFLHIMLFLIKKIFFKIFISKINFFYKKRPNPNFNYTYLIKKLENKNIALVGNSKNLLLKKNLIDSYDIVIRINHLPNKKYYDKIGKRCDILMLTHGPMHLINRDFKKIWLEKENIYYSNFLNEKIYNYKDKWFEELFKILKANPSTGARSLHFLIKILKNPKITLFGFSHESQAWYHSIKENWSNEQIKKVQNSSSILNNPNGHDFEAEKKYFNSLLSENIKYGN